MIKSSILAVSLLPLVACANTPVPDLGTSKTPHLFQADLKHCEWLADKNPDDKKLMLAVAGGTLAAATVHFAGDQSPYLSDVSTPAAAAGGAIAGLIIGVIAENDARKDVVKKCLENRGYNILAWR